MEKNTDETIWRGDHVVYLDRGDIYHFETNEKETQAWYTVDIPENAKSFSLSLKIGNSHSARKPGSQDHDPTIDSPRTIHSKLIEKEDPSVQKELKRVFQKFGIKYIELHGQTITFWRTSGQFTLIYSPESDLTEIDQWRYRYTDVTDWYSFFLNEV